LVHVLFSTDDHAIATFVQKHPTVSKQRLTMKIMTNFMISCTNKIESEEIDSLSMFKGRPDFIDISQFRHLLDFNFTVLSVDPASPEFTKKAPIEMNQIEIYTEALIEDLSVIVWPNIEKDIDRIVTYELHRGHPRILGEDFLDGDSPLALALSVIISFGLIFIVGVILERCLFVNKKFNKHKKVKVRKVEIEA